MSRDYCDHLIDLLAPWDVVSVRRMFGGYGVYRQGLIFGLVIEDVLYFKADEMNRPDYEAQGCEPFTYEAKGKRISIMYWQVPECALEEPEMLGEWAEKSYQASIRAQQKKPAKKKPAKV